MCDFVENKHVYEIERDSNKPNNWFAMYRIGIGGVEGGVGGAINGICYEFC